MTQEANTSSKKPRTIRNTMKRAYRLPCTGYPVVGTPIDEERKKAGDDPLCDIPSKIEITAEQYAECKANKMFESLVAKQKLRVI